MQHIVTLAPDRRRAAAWTAVGLVATALAAYAFGASRAGLVPAVLVALCAVPTGVFGLQVLAPEAWTLHLDRDGIRGMIGTFRVEESFTGLRAVELGDRGGEPVLVLVGPARTRTLWLPVGCDLDRLQGLLRDLAHDRARGR